MASRPIPEEDFGPDLEAFVAFLREEETKSQDQWLDDERLNALEAYNGEPYGDEEEGRSQAVTRDVAEVVDYMTVSLLRTMVSGDKVVEFDYPEANTPQQPPQPGADGQTQPPAPKPPSIAEQATAAVSHEFYQGQDGYRFLHDWIKAGLLEKTSTAKVCVEEQKPKRVEAEIGIDELTQLQESGAQIVGLEQIGEQAFRVAILQPQPPKFKDYVSPNEETCIAQDARDLDDDCVYRGFKMTKTLSQLAEMGFETEDLSDDSFRQSEGLADARDAGHNDYTRQGFSRKGANRKVWYFEEYSAYDLNEDGIAELVISHRVGNQILRYKDSGEYAIEEIDDQPGVVWCPFPMQHRIVGQSLADKVMDIQRIRTVLMRQGLDNIYLTNKPRLSISESAIGDTTIEDMLSVNIGGIIRHLGPQGPQPIAIPFAAQSAFEVMETLAGEKESRTGITRLNQGLDADALNKTATGTALMQAQGQQIEEYLARNFAEAFARLMLKKYRLMRKFGRPMTVMIDGQQVEVDPRTWPEDMNVVVRVGLGSGRKDQRVQQRQMLLEIAAAAVQNGSRVFTDENIYNNIKGLIADANLGNIRDLATDPSTLPPPEEQPDPAMAKAQADAMLQAEKLKADQARSAAELEMSQNEAAAKLQLMREEATAKLQLEREKATAEAALAQQQQAFEFSLSERQFEAEQARAERQMQMNERMTEHKAAMGEKETEARISKKRPGGDLDK